MATITKLQPDQIVWEIRRQKMGNTSVSRNAKYGIRIVSVDLEKRTVTASWNGNPPRVYRERDIAKWKVKEPQPKRMIMGLASY
jgi:hypothetical protein